MQCSSNSVWICLSLVHFSFPKLNSPVQKVQYLLRIFILNLWDLKKRWYQQSGRNINFMVKLQLLLMIFSLSLRDLKRRGYQLSGRNLKFMAKARSSSRGKEARTVTLNDSSLYFRQELVYWKVRAPGHAPWILFTGNQSPVFMSLLN